MPAVQTTYASSIRPAVPGMPASMYGYNADSRICESANIPFGVAVSQGSADDGATLGGTSPVGVAIRDVTLLRGVGDIANIDKFKQYETLGVMVQGEIWVLTDGAVTKGGVCTYDNTTGVLGSVAAGAGRTAFPGRWQSSTTGAGLAKLRVNLP